MQSFIISNSLCAEQSRTSLELFLKIIVYNETAQAAKLLDTRQQSARRVGRNGTSLHVVLAVAYCQIR